VAVSMCGKLYAHHHLLGRLNGQHAFDLNDAVKKISRAGSTARGHCSMKRPQASPLALASRPGGRCG
jgi:hypothetical protein